MANHIVNIVYPKDQVKPNTARHVSPSSHSVVFVTLRVPCGDTTFVTELDFFAVNLVGSYPVRTWSTLRYEFSFP